MPSVPLRAQVRAWARPVRYRARVLTAPARALPDFVILGAQKAGTTSLYAYLCAHPDVRAAARKEVHYFDLNYARGATWYRSMFPLAAGLALERRGGRRVLVGEASPYYLFYPLAAERAGAVVPSAQLIVLLRDPVERAWSHYRHEVKAGREPLAFEAALAAEPTRLAGADAALRAGASPEAHPSHRTFSYAARGRYAEQLRPWLAHYPREQLLVLRAEDLFERPREVWDETVAFLGLAPATPPAFQVHNPGTDQGMSAQARATLTEAFRQPNADLAELLGRDLGWSS